MGSDSDQVKHRAHKMSSSQGKVEVTRGVFDPRTYKTVDKDNWARKRKPEWMSTTGQIHYVRERQVPVEPKEEAPLEASSRATTPTKEVKAPAPVQVTAVKKAEVQWTGRRRNDITRDGGHSGYFGRTV